jgi:hypothetical protein
MDYRLYPTSFADVNLVLDHFRSHLQALWGSDLLGIYLVGSLALGDFNPRSSDIDFIVVTSTAIAPEGFTALQHIHTQFAASNSPWAERIEAIYVPASALRHRAANTSHYPQIEKGKPLSLAPLEAGWVFQCLTIRDHSMIVIGPNPRALVDTIDTQELYTAATMIVGQWMEQALHDPTWMPWLRQPHAQVFVVQTLCRLLHSLATGIVASKPRAAEWAQETYGEPWATFIEQSLINQHQIGTITQSEENKTLAFLAFTLERIQRSAASTKARAHANG